MIRILASLALLFFLLPVTYIHGTSPAQTRDLDANIDLQPILLDSRNPTDTKLGQLEYRGGWRMTSEHEDFGGISAMLAMPDNRFLMLTDAGILIGFTLNEETNVAERPIIASLPDGPPRPNPYARKNWDSESITSNPLTGQYWVGFEREHSVWRYGRAFVRKQKMQLLKAARDWPINGGVEAMVRLAKGIDGNGSTQFLLFSETAPFAKGGTQVLLANGDPAEAATRFDLFGYDAPKGYEVTDATALPDGRILLLHRRISLIDGWSAIISIADPREIRIGELWKATPIATLKPPYRVDNMEAITATQQGGETFVWIASDDNFNILQDSLLLKFHLLDDRKPATTPPTSETEKAEASPGFSTLK